MLSREEHLYTALAALDIAYDVVEHAATFTVAESEGLYASLPGTHVKNLFLKDAAGRYLLLVVPAATRVALKRLPAAIGCRSVSFGKPDELMRLLGVEPGSVTPLAAINDDAREVQVVLDAAVADAVRINVHPLRNTATLGMAAADLRRALYSWGHAPVIAAVPAAE